MYILNCKAHCFIVVGKSHLSLKNLSIIHKVNPPKFHHLIRKIFALMTRPNVISCALVSIPANLWIFIGTVPKKDLTARFVIVIVFPPCYASVGQTGGRKSVLLFYTNNINIYACAMTRLWSMCGPWQRWPPFRRHAKASVWRVCFYQCPPVAIQLSKINTKLCFWAEVNGDANLFLDLYGIWNHVWMYRCLMKHKWWLNVFAFNEHSFWCII